MSTAFIPRYGVGEGIYISCFLAVSAFCNAGFDVLGRESEYISLCNYIGVPLVMYTIMALIIVGGLGTAAFVQPFAMSNAMNNAFHIPTWIIVVIAALICGTVLIGGVTGIGRFCERVTPVMCVIYIITVLGIILTHINQVPQAIATIFEDDSMLGRITACGSKAAVAGIFNNVEVEE